MGYITKIQKVERPTNQSFYVNLPSALAQAIALEKGEECQWLVEDKNTLILVRTKSVKARKLHALKRSGQ
jgi:antitoxin component of MazEF toxin-antitoxin module